MPEDIRWKQRFHNYLRALRTLTEAVELAEERELSNLEQQGMVQGFEFTHELAWNVLKDYLEYQGLSGIIGSKDANRLAFKNGLITDGEAWMQMIRDRNLSSHAYHPDTAKSITENILTRFYPAFTEMANKFAALAQQPESD